MSTAKQSHRESKFLIAAILTLWIANASFGYCTQMSPVVGARLNYGAMQRRSACVYVRRISTDHGVKERMDTTARAVGADRAWTGSPGVPGY